MSARRGFTLIEMVMVVALIGVLATIAVPNLRDARYRAQAADVLSAVRNIELAYVAAGGPPLADLTRGSDGVVPPVLAPYLTANAFTPVNGVTLKISGAAGQQWGGVFVKAQRPQDQPIVAAFRRQTALQVVVAGPSFVVVKLPGLDASVAPVQPPRRP